MAAFISVERALPRFPERRQWDVERACSQLSDPLRRRLRQREKPNSLLGLEELNARPLKCGLEVLESLLVRLPPARLEWRIVRSATPAAADKPRLDNARAIQSAALVDTINAKNRCPMKVIPAEIYQRFKAQYVALRDLSRDSGKWPRHIIPELKAAGIHPLTEWTAFGAYVYRRDQMK